MSRSTVHGGKLLRLFNQKHWPNLICLDQPIDLKTAAGRFYASLLMSLAQMESEMIGERVHHGQVYAKQLMKPQSGKPPWGYRYTEGKMNYEIDGDAKDKAQGIVQELITTHSLVKAFEYQAAHCGQPFRSMEGLRRWLLNPAITGARVYGTCHWFIDEKDRKRRRIFKPGVVTETYAGTHPALITTEQQEQAAKVLRMIGRRQLTPISKRRTRVLTGLLECYYCGHTMYHHTQSDERLHYYRCTNQVCPKKPRIAIREEKAVQAAIDLLAENRHVLAHGGVIEELRANQQLTPEAEKLQQQIIALRSLGDPETAELIERKSQRLDALINERMDDGGARFNLQDAEAALERQEVWDELLATPESQRQLFSQWVGRLVVRDGQVVDARLRTEGEAGSTA